jgi:hypothetical protein
VDDKDLYIDKEALQHLLQRVKPIVYKRFNVPYENWVFFDGSYAYAFNGLYYWLEPFDAPQEMALPAKQIETMIAKTKSDKVYLLFGRDSVSVEIDGKQADFNYPFRSIAYYMKSFYVETVPREDFIPVPSSITDAIKFCSKSIFPENVEYSNIYVVNGIAYASNGMRIAEAYCELPDTKLSIGIDKVLDAIGQEPESVLNKVHSLSFWFPSGLLSMSKNVGKPEAITNFIPDTQALTESFEITDSKSWMRALKSAKAFDDEFKKKDMTLHIEVADSKAVITTTGVKARYTQEIEDVPHTSAFEFNIHPDVLLPAIEMEADVIFGDADFICAVGQGKRMYMWVER